MSFEINDIAIPAIIVLLCICICLLVAILTKFFKNQISVTVANISAFLSFILALLTFLIYIRIITICKDTDNSPGPEILQGNTKIDTHVYPPLKTDGSTIKRRQEVLNNDSLKPTPIFRLIIDVSRAVENCDIIIDDTLKGKCPRYTVDVSEGNHAIIVKYKNKLGQQYEYSDTINVSKDGTIFLTSDVFRPK